MRGINPGSMMALAIVMLNITTILLILRILGRRKQKIPIGIDDICAVLSWIGLVAMCINMITAVAYQRWGIAIIGAANPSGDMVTFVFTDEYLDSMHFQFVQETALPLQLMFAKLSILFFYRRLLCPDRTGLVHWATLVTAGITVLWGGSMLLLWLLQCGPNVSMYWSDPSIDSRSQCWGVYNTLIAASSDCLLDIVILVIPIRPLSRLQISKRKKLLVMGVFATGALSVAASLVRVWVYAAVLDSSNTTFASTNSNLILSLILFWGLFEAGFAVIAACLPSTKFWLDTAVAVATGRDKFGAYTKSYGSGYSTPRTAASPRSPRSPDMAYTAFKDAEKGNILASSSA